MAMRTSVHTMAFATAFRQAVSKQISYKAIREAIKCWNGRKSKPRVAQRKFLRTNLKVMTIVFNIVMLVKDLFL